ncbi:hypothetical protein CEY11_24295 [Candidimonas nitroreducens]|uniref:Uncharacterized protein n=1 Tax=Candidimonas nitroreducens TaxID=683354 RepID=A0A225M205_9BURK|nr:hypothetical protein CEY11_24295 [Candidimonas nitroreducens]
MGAAGVGAAAFASVGLACGPQAAACLLVPTAAWLGLRRPWRSPWQRAHLELHPVHGWMLQRGNERRRLRLVLAWPSSGWLTLRFASAAPADSHESASKQGRGAKPRAAAATGRGGAISPSLDCGSGSKENMLDLTVWKPALPADDWRRLRLSLVCLPAQPAAWAEGGAS